MGDLRFDDRVVIVTGAGNGLGRSHALDFASRGAKVVVNDLGGTFTGEGGGTKAADTVVDEIEAAGGQAVANYDSVTDGEKIVQTALDTWGRIDVVVNNAGILRDVSFHKMTQDDWDKIYQVHVLGSFRVTHAAWPHMREQKYGRVIMTASAAGIYGNFGQANYSMAKLGLAGFGSTLAIEGRKRGIHVNTIAPIAGSRMTETVLPPELIAALKPEYVSPLVVWLCSEECEESGGLFEVGGGFMGKLRWERTMGKMWRVGREMKAEDVRGGWDAIVDFGATEHPGNVTESMRPIMENLDRGESKGGNEWVDVDEALGFEFDPVKSSYDERDLALYALGVGAAKDPTGDDLKLVYEMHGDGFRALPSYAVIPAVNVILELGKKGITAPGLNYGLDRVLHGEQYTEVKRPLPRSAKLKHKARIKDIFDKGKGALVITEIESFDEDGDLLMVNELTTFVRGAGGWGGDRGPSADVNVPPERKPDFVVEETTDQNQALLYRLSGDWNPLHADPSFAKAMKFDKPILHGLCTFGFATRHVLDKCAPDGDVRYFKSIKVRFAKTVFPGETLVTEIWKENDQRVVFQVKVKERDEVVISNAAIELYEEIPKKVAKKKAAPKAKAPSGPTSADIFRAIEIWMGEAGGEAKIGKVFQFKLSGPESVWTIDCVDAAVGAGETKKPDCTLELTDGDFVAMCKGEKDPQKMYFGGELKIGGDIMASQKLTFLKKVEERHVSAAMAERGDAGGAEAPVSNEPISADIFEAIGLWMNENPQDAKIGKVFQFKLSGPESVWTVDCVDASVGAGETKKPDCTLELTDPDFVAMCKGEKDPQKMYFGGELKIGGDIMASQKLTFLKKVDERHVRQAMENRLGAGGGAAPAASGKPGSADIFGGIGNWMSENDADVKKVGKVFQFKLTDPESVWTLDCGDASVSAGESKKPDCTLELTDENFLAMCNGEKDPQKMYFGGELKVSGDIMASQKLSFLQKVEERHVAEAMKANAGGGAAAAAAAASSSKREAVAPKIFESLQPPKNGAVKIQFLVVEPDGAWFVDLGAGSIKSGVYDGADTTITIEDGAIEELVGGASEASLFQKGKMRVDGDVAPARDLHWLKK